MKESFEVDNLISKVKGLVEIASWNMKTKVVWKYRK